MGSAAAVRLSEVIGALSYALDITDGQPPGHALRSCMIGMRLANECGLDADGLNATFYGLLMKDAGCSSNAAAVSALYGTDDLEAKRRIRTVNYSRPSEALGYIVRTVGRRRDLVRVARAGKVTASAMTEIRCERGAEIARMLELPPGASEAIRSLGEHWDGRGHPSGLKGEAIPLLARIFCLAQTVEVYVRDFGVDSALAMAQERSGSWFDPRLVQTLHALRADAAFWESVASEDVRAELESLAPGDRLLVADESRLDRVAEAFALVIDAKSPYTSRHSARVAEFAVQAATELGFAAAELRDLRRAALLHDIGKLAIPNSILDKPAALTAAERAQIEQHPRLSEEILSRVEPFRGIAGLAGAHHERLDGAGYWRGLTASELDTPARVLAVADVFEALTAERPYRAAMSDAQALALVEASAGRHLDADAIEALAAALASPVQTLAA